MGMLGTLYPAQQLTEIQSVFGEQGANLAGIQVEEGKETGKKAVFETSCDVQNPESEQKKQQILAELTARRNELGALYRELQGFKDDPDFWSRGFAATGREAWLRRVENAGAGDKSQSEEYGRGLARTLSDLGMAYQRSKGTETDMTRDDLKLFMADFRKIAPEYQGLGTPFHGIIRLVKKLNTGTTTVSQATALIVLRNVGDVFEVASTCEQYAFYKTTDPATCERGMATPCSRANATRPRTPPQKPGEKN
jgi:hypothetical protein